MSTDDRAESPGATRSASWRIIYSNIIGLGFGENEARIAVGFDHDLTKPGAVVTEEAVIVMPHRAAKLLAFTLNGIINNWEAANGPIPLPAERVQQIEQQLQQQFKKPDDPDKKA